MSGRINGFVEHLSRQEVTGWAFDPAAPQAPAQVGLWIDGRAVASASANRERGDLTVLNVGRINLGFRLPVPPGITLDRSRLAVRIVGRGGPLPMSDTAGACEGRLEVVESGRISGWAWRVGSPEERITLLVRSGSAIIGRVTAGAFRADLRANGVGDGSHAFEALLPAQAKDLSVIIEATGQTLPGLQGRSGSSTGQGEARPARSLPPPRAPAPAEAPPRPAPVAPPTVQSEPAMRTPRRLTPSAPSTPAPVANPPVAAQAQPAAPAASPAHQAPPPPPAATLSPEVIEAMRAALNFDPDEP